MNAPIFTKFFALFILALPSLSRASEKNECSKLKKELSELEEKIVLAKGTLKDAIAKQFPINQQNIVLLTEKANESLDPIILFRNAKDIPTKQKIEQKMRSDINFIKDHTHTSTRKDVVFRILNLCEVINKVRQFPLTASAASPREALAHTYAKVKKEIELAKQKNTLLNAFLKLNITKKVRDETILISSENETPYILTISTLNNYHLIFDKLYDSPQTYCKGIKPEPIPCFTLKPTVNKQITEIYLQILELLTKKINFTHAKPTIFTAFDSKDKNVKDSSKSFQESKARLEKLQSSIGKKLQAFFDDTNAKFPITPSFEKMSALAVKSLEKHPKKLKKYALKIKTILDNKAWLNTLVALMQFKADAKQAQEKSYAEAAIALFNDMHKFAKDYVPFINNPENIQMIKEKFQSKQGEKLLPLCYNLFKSSPISLQSPDGGKAPPKFNLDLCGFLFILDLCKEIDQTFAPNYNEIQALFQQKDLLLTKINQLKQKNISNQPEIEIEKRDLSAQPKNFIKKELVKGEAPKPQSPLTLTFTKKLKIARELAPRSINPQGSLFQNELSDAEASLFHNLPIISIIEHPEIKQLCLSFLNNETLPATNTIAYQVAGEKISLWIPVILSYQINGTEQIQKGVIEIFLSKEAEIDTLKVFHIWFKNQNIFEPTAKTTKNTVQKIQSILASLNQETATVKNAQELIAAKDGWAIDIQQNGKILLLNANEKPTQNNWIMYQT